MWSAHAMETDGGGEGKRGAMGLLVIGREAVRELLPMADCIGLMREAMIALSSGLTRQPLRQIVPLTEHNLFGVMPGEAPVAFGAKLISIFPAAVALGRPSHQGLVALFDHESGEVLAILHASEITAIRTAAASAAATDALARPEAHRLALLGYGEQARTHALSMACVRPLSGIRVWGRSADRAARFAREMEADLGLPVTVCEDAKTAVADADIVCTLTAAREPVLLGEWVRPGTHVNLVGSGMVAAREVDDALVVRARMFADHREGVLEQGGEVVHAMAEGLVGPDHVLGEIGEVFAGRRTGRTAPDQITAYKSLGAIVQDLYSGWRVYERARAEGLGVKVPF